jgi:hypothetical protein
MTTQEFDRLFDLEVTKELAPLGFSPRGKNSMTLDLLDGIMLVSLLRLGGRLMMPGSAAWTLCFRHTCLRELNELKVVTGVSGLFTQDYPFKFTPSELMEGRRELRYHAELNWQYDRFTYATVPAARVQAQLRALADFIGERFVPWARSQTPSAARDQLRQFGSGRWDEKIWLEDYDTYLQMHPETGASPIGGQGKSPRRSAVGDGPPLVN